MNNSGQGYQGTQLLQPPEPPSPNSPLILCFHGSGETCVKWWAFAQLVSKSYRVLLYERGPHDPRPKVGVPEMIDYLADSKLEPPYVLVAHSYGGSFARQFLDKYPENVAGMVMVETGQETSLEPEVEKRQYKRTILGNKPLSVIRGNSLLWNIRRAEKRLAEAGDDEAEQERYKAEMLMLGKVEKEDENLKKRQLALSTNTRYTHLPDCGHHVVRDRPDVVAEETRWVMEYCETHPWVDERNSDRKKRVMRIFHKFIKS